MLFNLDMFRTFVRGSRPYLPLHHLLLVQYAAAQRGRLGAIVYIILAACKSEIRWLNIDVIAIFSEDMQ